MKKTMLLAAFSMRLKLGTLILLLRESFLRYHFWPSRANRPVPRPGVVTVLICSVLLLVIGHVSPAQATDEVPAQSAAPVVEPVATDLTVALVNGQPIKASELDAHVTATQLPREEALEDVIDLRLVRDAAAAKQVSAPIGPWSAEVRASIELALANALGFDVPPPRVSLVVDHAWHKDAEDEKIRTADRAQMEQLRTLVEAGATIPEAYTKLRVDGAAWHIGDHEEYPYEVIPSEAHDLPPGSLSPIIPGNGGLHLFKIYQRKQELPPSSEIRSLLSESLRRDATIVRSETPPPSIQNDAQPDVVPK